MDVFESMFLSFYTQRDSHDWRLHAREIVIQLAESRIQASHQMTANWGEDISSTTAIQQKVHKELETPYSKKETKNLLSDDDDDDLEVLNDRKLPTMTPSCLNEPK